jgi:biopolymer transport protein ExbB
MFFSAFFIFFFINVFLFAFIVFGCFSFDTAKNAAQAAEAATDKMSLLELVWKGGVIMIPLGILSLISVFVFVERYIYIKKASRSGKNFLNSMRDVILSDNLEAAKALCKNADNPQARMIAKGISRMDMPYKDIEDAMENVGKIEVYNLEKNINVLGIIAGLAPMFGFVGTIFGVIKIFYSISLTNNISIGAISGGLYEKMITSATGLIIGAFSFILFHWLNILVNKTIQKMEVVAIEFLDMVQDTKKIKN